MNYIKKAAATVASCLTLFFISHLFISKSMFCQDAKFLSQIEYVLKIRPEIIKDQKIAKVTIERTDVPVLIGDVKLNAFMGLESWATFQRIGSSALMVGKLALFEDEVNSTISMALDNKLEVSSLYSPYFFDNPKIYSLQIRGVGKMLDLATSMKKIWDNIKQIRQNTPQPASQFDSQISSKDNSIDSNQINMIFNTKSQYKDGMVKIQFGRKTILKDKYTIDSNMGVMTWATFTGADTNAIVNGQFTLLEDELQPVLKILRDGNINIVSINNYTTHDTPRIFLVHFWGKGQAGKLAHTLKSALDKTQINIKL